MRRLYFYHREEVAWTLKRNNLLNLTGTGVLQIGPEDCQKQYSSFNHPLRNSAEIRDPKYCWPRF